MKHHEKTVEQQYVVLSEIDHILLRPGMYIGSMAMHEGVEWVFDPITKKFAKQTINYVPAFIKIFNEILDNAIDEHKRNPKKLDTIKVDISDEGEITITDNGGIPVQQHAEHGKYIPEIIFGMLRSGSNYNDDEDQAVIGTNGIGSKATNIFSKWFIVKTGDGQNQFKQEFKNNLKERSEPKVKPGTHQGTTIEFLPDYERFGMKSLDADTLSKIRTAVYNAAGCNEDCKFYFNGERIHIKSFKDYVNLYTENFQYDETDTWKIAIAHAGDEEFSAISFVNSVNTYEGGTHIDYVVNQITNKLREFFKKKHKVEVTPSQIKAHMQLFISCTVNRPKFDSQTKSRMISEPRDYKTSYEVPDKFIKKLLDSPIIQSVLDWVQLKAAAAERAELRKLNKDVDKGNLRKITKFTDAASKNRHETMLFVTEGLSAASAILSARDPNKIGSYPLRGKPLNVSACDNAKLLENVEFKDLLMITGLKIGEKPQDIRFGKIVFCADMDSDGFSINGILINMFFEFWPDLFKQGKIAIFRTPIVKVTHGKKELRFYSMDEYTQWKDANGNPKHTFKYLKGLGSSLASDFKSYFAEMDTHLVTIKDDQESRNMLQLIYGKEQGMSDKRKTWLNLQ